MPPLSRPAYRPTLVALLGALVALACSRKEPPGADSTSPAASGAVQAGSPTLPPELSAKRAAPPASATPPAEAPPHPGPWMAVTAAAAGVYSAPEFERSSKIGYVRGGGRVPVEAEPVSKKSCTGGWYKVVTGGYICGNLGTTDLNHPEVKFGTKAPNLDEVLPYTYARNAKHGTPLYKNVPSREQMLRYEPYLSEDKNKNKNKDEDAKKKDASAPKETDGIPSESAVRPASMSGDLDAGVAVDPGMADAGIAVEAPEKPWWQQDDIKERLHEVTLEHLEADADDILAKRMVTGFYVAVDRTFRWNGRLWYKTTKGLVTPSERFWQTAGSKFKGVELDGQNWKLPVAWVYGGRKSASTYRREGDKLTPAETIERFVALQLTGKFEKIAGNEYAETASGTWIRRSQLRITEPGAPPADLAESERWVDVDLDSQTLVAFEGTRPVYATLISSGKSSKIEEKDHRTPLGEWRVREKHITTTMDGDGSAAGDLPYSIEDVPYVIYYHRSYALHGAFWHGNFGVQMSHGCVNLAPLDAKHLFFFTDPPLPQGFHGVWASAERPGSRVVVHE